MAEEKKKIKTAVALEYDPSDEAPRVIASGKGALAEKIIERQRKAMFPFTRMISLRTRFQNLRSAI